MNNELEQKLQSLYKDINSILPLKINFDFFDLEVDRGGVVFIKVMKSIWIVKIRYMVKLRKYILLNMY